MKNASLFAASAVAGRPAVGGPALEGFEGQPPARGVPDDELAVEDQAVRQRLAGRGQVGESVLDERAATGVAPR